MMTRSPSVDIPIDPDIRDTTLTRLQSTSTSSPEGSPLHRDRTPSPRDASGEMRRKTSTVFSVEMPREVKREFSKMRSMSYDHNLLEVPHPKSPATPTRRSSSATSQRGASAAACTPAVMEAAVAAAEAAAEEKLADKAAIEAIVKNLEGTPTFSGERGTWQPHRARKINTFRQRRLSVEDFFSDPEMAEVLYQLKTPPPSPEGKRSAQPFGVPRWGGGPDYGFARPTSSLLAAFAVRARDVEIALGARRAISAVAGGAVAGGATAPLPASRGLQAGATAGLQLPERIPSGEVAPRGREGSQSHTPPPMRRPPSLREAVEVPKSPRRAERREAEPADAAAPADADATESAVAAGSATAAGAGHDAAAPTIRMAVPIAPIVVPRGRGGGGGGLGDAGGGCSDSPSSSDGPGTGGTGGGGGGGGAQHPIEKGPRSCSSTSTDGPSSRGSPASASEQSWSSIRSPLETRHGIFDRPHKVTELGEDGTAEDELPFSRGLVSAFSCHGIEPAPLLRRDIDPGAQDKINQDCATICHPYCADPNCALFTVMDGHGRHGEVVSNAAMEFVVAELERRMLDDAPITAALAGTYEGVNAHLAADEYLAQQAHHSGACGLTILLHCHRMWVANAGDCRAVLGLRRKSSGALDALRLSFDHKPNEPSEKDRLEALGSYVSAGSEEPFEPSRLYRDASRLRLGPGLAMSRCLGDLGDVPCGISPTPHVAYRELGQDDDVEELFVVLASDGVWEHLDDLQVVEMVDAFHAAGKPAKMAATNVIARSAVAWRIEEGNYRDDITAIVAYLPCL